MDQFSQCLQDHKFLSDRKVYSEDLISRVRERTSKSASCTSGHVCVYAAGSLARHETGRSSDLDIFLIGDKHDRDAGTRSVSKLEELKVFADLIRINEELGLEPFSGDGQFLKIHELDDIIKGTGCSNDDSENLFTCRLLLLLESTPIAGSSVYERAIDRVLEMYFRDGRGRKDFRPLFILNDILRYWRTLCLNYERDRTSKLKPWWKRNLNLKFPRKLTVFSTVLSIISSKTIDETTFKGLTELTPMERLAQSLDKIDNKSLINDFKKVLDDYEEFLAAKSHKELDSNDSSLMTKHSSNAQNFDYFFHKVFSSDNLDKNLVRYLLI